jgi:hypothetical protein
VLGCVNAAHLDFMLARQRRVSVLPYSSRHTQSSSGFIRKRDGDDSARR